MKSLDQRDKIIRIVFDRVNAFDYFGGNTIVIHSSILFTLIEWSPVFHFKILLTPNNFRWGVLVEVAGGGRSGGGGRLAIYWPVQN